MYSKVFSTLSTLHKSKNIKISCIKRYSNSFVNRHVGISKCAEIEILNEMGEKDLDMFIKKCIPSNIYFNGSFKLDDQLSEHECLNKLNELSNKNQIYRSFIGMGYNDTIIPTVISYNVINNLSWTTPYTAYQPEISQGRLESLLNFQTMISSICGLPVSNASLLDGSSALTEALSLAFRYNSRSKCLILNMDKTNNQLEYLWPQDYQSLQTKAYALNISLECKNFYSNDVINFEEYCAVVVSLPATNGSIYDLTSILHKATEHKTISIATCDLLALCLIEPPKCDIIVGNCQRFGVPLGYGGPHAGFIAVSDQLKRLIPGRIVGVSKDKHGKNSMRLALQTREQHIRRDKATSNICTAQALLANMSAMYSIYHGPEGLKNIAKNICALTNELRKILNVHNYATNSEPIFDTINVILDDETVKDRIIALSKEYKINFRTDLPNRIGITLNETTTHNDLLDILKCFSIEINERKHDEVIFNESMLRNFVRNQPLLNQTIFNKYHTEVEMVRYIKSLETKDLSLVHSMIPLGSCTMKLNGCTELLSLTNNNWTKIHPFCPKEQAAGYDELIKSLSDYLCELTGMDACSFQSNSGAHGEYSGLLTIKRYFDRLNQKYRDVCLIPSSAHGTNPSSAKAAGYHVETLEVDKNGLIDLLILKEKIKMLGRRLAVVMITYPSTNGIFDETVQELCELVKKSGAQVYMDGANMNAQVGICKPGLFGVDVCHLNLHKTFCIPHGGGGPGMGPIFVKQHLKDYLPGHWTTEEPTNNSISSSAYSSASLLTIPWAYIRMMGIDGLRKATQIAILNANYMKHRLSKHYDIMFKGMNNNVAHEFIVDLRQFKKSANIDPIDVAKRLMDYGFHAPTISWPIVGSLMIEPTESENKHELDRYIDSLISIRNEIKMIEDGHYHKNNNPLKNAPHVLEEIVATEWKHPYTRETAAYPMQWLKDNKFWPTRSRIDDAYGDLNFTCNCQ